MFKRILEVSKLLKKIKDTKLQYERLKKKKNMINKCNKQNRIIGHKITQTRNCQKLRKTNPTILRTLVSSDFVYKKEKHHELETVSSFSNQWSRPLDDETLNN